MASHNESVYEHLHDILHTGNNANDDDDDVHADDDRNGSGNGKSIHNNCGIHGWIPSILAQPLVADAE